MAQSVASSSCSCPATGLALAPTTAVRTQSSSAHRRERRSRSVLRRTYKNSIEFIKFATHHGSCPTAVMGWNVNGKGKRAPAQLQAKARGRGRSRLDSSPIPTCLGRVGHRNTIPCLHARPRPCPGPTVSHGTACRTICCWDTYPILWKWHPPKVVTRISPTTKVATRTVWPRPTGMPEKVRCHDARYVGSTTCLRRPKYAGHARRRRTARFCWFLLVPMAPKEPRRATCRPRQQDLRLQVDSLQRKPNARMAISSSNGLGRSHLV